MRAIIFILLAVSPSWIAALDSDAVKLQGASLLDDGVHSHPNPYRSHEHFKQNQFTLNNGNVAGYDSAIGKDAVISEDDFLQDKEYELSIGNTRQKRFLSAAIALPAVKVATAYFIIGQIEYFSGIFKKATSVRDEAKEREKIISSLNKIQDIAINTQKGVKELLIAIDFNIDKEELEKATTKILGDFNAMVENKENGAHTEAWDNWAEAVIERNTGTFNALSVINTKITESGVIKKFKERVESKADLTRTVAGSIDDFYSQLVFIQMIGFQTLDKAYEHLQDCEHRSFKYRTMISRFNEQYSHLKAVEDSLETIFLTNNKWGPSEYFYLWHRKQSCASSGSAKCRRKVTTFHAYAHLLPVEADKGKVVTGVQLYEYRNRLAIKIKQGKLQEFGKIDSEEWKEASGWGDREGTDYMKIDKKHNLYQVNINIAKVPIGHAIVGVSFYKSGSTLRIQVKTAAIDYLTGNIGTQSQWVKSSGGDNINFSDYVDKWKVETKPASMLTAAALYFKGNRLALKVSDVFTPKQEGKSCVGKYPNVIMEGNYECCNGYLYSKEASQICTDSEGPRFRCCSGVISTKNKDKDWDCCSEGQFGPCDIGEGDCDKYEDCLGSLICGVDNCRRDFNPKAHKHADCCTPNLCFGFGSKDWDCCRKGQCGLGDGDCDVHSDCKGDLICGKNNCKNFKNQAHSAADCCTHEYSFLVIAGDRVADSFNNIESAKAKLWTVQSGSRMIAQVDNKLNKLKRDPHEVGGQKQGAGREAGFNKYWNDWNDINRMMDVAQLFLDASMG